MKSCPFCGGKPHIFSNFEIYIQCMGCGAKGKKRQLPGYTSKKNWELILKFKVVRDWNHRV